jgi:hypothetical protein
MSNTGVRTPQGPNEAEQRMLAVWDTFDTLLRRRPTDAKRMSYELAEVAAKYKRPQQPTKGTNRD